VLHVTQSADGIPTIRDRVVQMALKLVLEPIFEVDFYPASYGYRPARRAQDAIAEIAHFIMPPSSYEYVVEGDIKACFDNVHHGVLMAQLRLRVGDRKVLALLKAFLVAGVVKETGRLAATLTGTPQGGIISPLLANVYLSALDRHFERAWKQQTRYIGCSTYYRRRGHATYRLIRYADDFVVVVRGTREQAEAIRDEAARVLHDELKMELSAEKTLVTHVDDGFNFLGHRIRRAPWKGSLVAMTYPSKKSLEAIKYKVKRLTTRSTTYLSLKTLLWVLNPVLRGWATYFRYDASKRTLAYVDHFAWWRVFRWLRKKHPKRTWRYLKTRYCDGRWRINDGGLELFRPSRVKVERYRFRGTRILLPWMEPDELGKVGRFAGADVDDPALIGALQESLSMDDR
jgi:RNA-directed DNA polymerase